MRTPWLVRLLPLTLLPACVIRLPDEGDDEVGETADESTDASETTSAGTETSDATSESSDTTDATSESSDTTETTDTTDTTDTGDEDCPPLPESPAYFDYSLDIVGMGSWDANITWACTVIESNTLDGLTMTLDCPDSGFPVTLSVIADPLLNPPLMDGAAITLRYLSEGPWWYNKYLRLDMDGFGHLFTIIDGDSLEPPMPQYEFDMPFPITAVSGFCDPEPDDCGDSERLGLAFELGGEPIVMFDPNYAIVGGDPGTDVWVEEARHVENLQCTDTPNDWFRVMIANTGWE